MENIIRTILPARIFSCLDRKAACTTVSGVFSAALAAGVVEICLMPYKA
jgi:hypothetical protein